MINIENAGLRAAVYARVSTEEREEGQTIDSQLAELEEFADANGLDCRCCLQGRRLER
jgi:DNA invertase Pin-like site-specific DNA recombinase